MGTYTTEKLDALSREISITSILIALRANIPPIIHMHCALNVVLTRKELIEVIVQRSIYAVYPAAVNAVEIARKILRKIPERKDKLNSKATWIFPMPFLSRQFSSIPKKAQPSYLW